MEASRVESLVRQVGEDHGYDVIQVKVDHTRNVRVWVDHAEGVTAGSTRKLSKEICFALDDAGTDPGAYRFEVQSPGVDRLLARPKDFERFKGKQITLRPHKREDTPAKLTGLLKGWIDEQVAVEIDGELRQFPLADLREVRLVPVLPFLSEGEQRAQRNARKNRGKQKKGGKAKPSQNKGGHPKGKGKGKTKGKGKRKKGKR